MTWQLHNGFGTPGTISGQNDNDNYIDGSTGDLYQLQSNTWLLIGNIKVPAFASVITNTIGTGTTHARADAGIEIQGQDAGFSLFNNRAPGVVNSDESFITFSAYDDASTIKKTASISSKWANASSSTGNGVLRLNVTSDGGITQNVDFRIFGEDGIVFFGSSDTTGPGNKINCTYGQINIRYDGSNIAGNFYYFADFRNNGQTKGLLLGYDNSETLGIISSVGATSGLSFWSHNGSNWGERIRVHTNGYIGIGKTSPSYLLELGSDSAGKPSTNTWTIVSDKRIKRNIRDFKDGLDKINKLNPVLYKYNGLGNTIDDDKDNIGLIAQDIQDIIPYAISKYKIKLKSEDEKETELLHFNSHSLTFILINAIKEQQKQIDDLKDEINKLKKRLNARTKKI